MNRPVLLLAGLLAACALKATPGDGGPSDAGPPRVPVTANAVDTRLVVMDQMMASVEMQLSGEQLAEAMGRDLALYDRNRIPSDLYGEERDLLGYSTAVESYEYSKQPMNQLAFESGAGVSLAWGPVINASGVQGVPAMQILQDAVQVFGWASHLTTLVTWDSGLGSATNPLGWPGFWPTLHPFRSFDPTINPSNAVAWRCSLAGDESSTRNRGLLFEDYECDANTLHLPDREAQVEKVLTPGASGWSDWKYGLWVMNYLQILHDSMESPVVDVRDEDLVEVGGTNNLVRPRDEATVPGVYLGSSNVEGFQGGFFLTIVENQFQHWLSSLTTTDGTTLSGFPDLTSALAYDFAAPLRWIPAEIAVTETADDSGFPRPTSYFIQSPESRLLDLAGLIAGAATFFAVTDEANMNVGGAIMATTWFDGHPFPPDNQLPDGEGTLHDRSLALLRFLIVSVDRLHADPTTGVLADTVTFAQGQPLRGSTTDIASVSYSLVALRTARRALTSQLELYSNNTPDMASRETVLDAVPFHGAPGNAPFAARLSLMINAQAELLMKQLTTSDGRAFSGWDFAAKAPTDTADTLDAHAAAIRGLLAGYLVTGDTRYRDRALNVFERLDRTFYDPSARSYVVTAQATEVTFTPRRFALLQGALRDVYILIGARPGQEALGSLLGERLARLNKLVLNGWDDRNGNELVDWPDECIRVVDGHPRGGLQMAERSLTGETGTLENGLQSEEPRVITTDREHDCVPDITVAHVPAALARSIHLQWVRP